MREQQYTWSGTGVKRLCLSLPLRFLVRHPNEASLHHDDVSTDTDRPGEPAMIALTMRLASRVPCRNRAMVISRVGKDCLPDIDNSRADAKVNG